MLIFQDRKFRVPRIWSNNELRKVAHLFSGSIINVSGWQDIDKQGNRYKDYFVNCKSYTVSNYSGYRGYQSKPDEIFIDLEGDLPSSLISKYDLVFNHTTLEHVINVFKAFENICLLSSDVVILVTPFAQQAHTSESYGDYWRFTPLITRKLFESNGLKIVYQSMTPYRNCSIYNFTIAARHYEFWDDRLREVRENVRPAEIGENVIFTNSLYKGAQYVLKIYGKVLPFGRIPKGGEVK